MLDVRCSMLIYLTKKNGPSPKRLDPFILVSWYKPVYSAGMIKLVLRCFLIVFIREASSNGLTI